VAISSVYKGTKILNICLHGIGMPTRPLESDEEKFWITEVQFADLLEVITRYPSIRITFDDGNASDAAIALPHLREHNLTATFFVIAERLDQPGSLTSADVRRLVDGGMRVGSHGMAHLPWRSLDDSGLRRELVDAADAITAAAGQPVREVACPFGDYDRGVLAALRRCGFDRVYTVDGGLAHSGAWLQSRYTVRADDTPDSIERRVRSPRDGIVTAAVRAGKSMVKRWR
jgi:peptidoglycan/xylan/chitin deacetylase (PgdA/CDA1 family)